MKVGNGYLKLVRDESTALSDSSNSRLLLTLRYPLLDCVSLLSVMSRFLSKGKHKHEMVAPESSAPTNVVLAL
jgi:hypothetical protein